MSDGAIKRTQYLNVSAGTVRTGATGHGESLTDIEGYAQPMEQARGRGLFDWGVAEGLEARVTVAVGGVTVKPGVALDKVGRTIVVASGGVVVTDLDHDPGQVLDVPTVPVPADGVLVPTAGPAREYLLTATWGEVQEESALANAPVLLHAPRLRLVPTAGFVDTGEQVALAQVSVDDAGLVTGLAPGPRRSCGVPTGRVTLHAPVLAPGSASVDQAPVAELSALATGGMAVSLLSGTVPKKAFEIEPGTAEISVAQGITTPVLRMRSPNGATFEASTHDDGNWCLFDPGASKNRINVDPSGNVGVGIGERGGQRIVHVEGNEVHSGGSGGGFSFTDRNVGNFVEIPDNGERWVWYGLDGAAHLWSGFDRLTVSAVGEGGGLDVSRRMRVRQGGDSSAGIWFHQDGPNADRAFTGMADDTHIGLWGNTGAGWGLQMDTSTGELSFASQFGRRWAAATLNLWGSTISDVGRGTLSIRSGGGTVAFDGDDNVVFGKHVQVTGDLNVRGRILKGGGGFRIDHPLAPENKYLSHSFVESPEMATLYAGTTTTDSKGQVHVVLPDYFDALNRDARVHLTTIGSLSAVTLDSAGVSHGSFTILTSEPEVSVSWIVTGVRVDAWAEAHRIEVEEDKAPAEQAKFLHAAEHSQPPSANLLGPPPTTER